jgi:putative Mn2+ efflux pump MntP
MVLWLSVVLIAPVSNVDNLAAGVAFGVRGTRIAAAPNLVIAAVTMAATAGAMTTGRTLSHALTPSAASALGGLVIGAIGVWTILASLHTVRRTTPWPERRAGGWQRDRSSLGREPGAETAMSLHEAVALGVALALNNVATGVGAGVAAISPLATTVLAGGLSLICVGGGSRVGLPFRRLVSGSDASLISGAILLGVAATILGGAG